MIDGRHLDVEWDVQFTAEVVDPAPAPVPDELPVHGPAVSVTATPVLAANGAVSWHFGCEYEIWDNDAGLWDWTYVANLRDPNGNQIANRTDWTSNRPSFGGALSRDISDPAEGTYTCTLDWWVDYYYLGQVQMPVSVSYSVPGGETTLENAWSGLIPTAYKWRGRLTGGSFVGRQVQEANGGNDYDDCWWDLSEVPKQTGLTPGDPWDVGANSEYGDDTVGWLPDAVDYYRRWGRAPCRAETDQIMKINRPGSSWVQYKTNRLKMGFTDTTVWSERDGHTVSKNY